jgi:hypothetical protein
VIKSRVSIWVPLYIDIDKAGEDIVQDDVEEALADQYGTGPTVEVILDFMPDWEIVDEWEENDET